MWDTISGPHLQDELFLMNMAEVLLQLTKRNSSQPFTQVVSHCMTPIQEKEQQWYTKQKGLIQTYWNQLYSVRVVGPLLLVVTMGKPMSLTRGRVGLPWILWCIVMILWNLCKASWYVIQCMTKMIADTVQGALWWGVVNCALCNIVIDESSIHLYLGADHPWLVGKA